MAFSGGITAYSKGEFVVTETPHIDTAGLQAIPPECAGWFAADMERMIAQVEHELSDRPDLSLLIGQNTLHMMHLFNQHHAQLVLAALQLSSVDLLIRTVPWLYRTYHSRGFSHGIFPLALQSWKKAVRDKAEASDIQPVLALYDFLSEQHEMLIQRSRSKELIDISLPPESDGMQQIFTTLLLNGDYIGCFRLAEQAISTTEELRCFYEHVLRHALYTVGTLWERNELTVAEEHQATAIAGRITSHLYARFVGVPQSKGTAIVTAAPNEFHEVGARMVADVLEFDGWNVTYLGANFPVEGLLELLRRHQPFLLALSVATPFNLARAKELIATIRSKPEFSSLKIVVGGLAFSIVPHLWYEFGADGYGAGLDELAALCTAWWQDSEVKK
ncbi:MAG TPA: cobalamin B12-binding domain-containing protein [Desulfuromonadales bacterium]|nr:cobalamin B12-binding domain-containing protein [Desulfuromonadales bacterium]